MANPKCPNCRSLNTRAGLDKFNCTDCGRSFDGDGNLQDERGPFLVGNMADLQRMGVEHAIENDNLPRGVDAKTAKQSVKDRADEAVAAGEAPNPGPTHAAHKRA